MSAADYLALAQQCPRVFIEGVPQLGRQQRDEARRLVMLVDVLYNAQVRGEIDGCCVCEQGGLCIEEVSRGFVIRAEQRPRSSDKDGQVLSSV